MQLFSSTIVAGNSNGERSRTLGLSSVWKPERRRSAGLRRHLQADVRHGIDGAQWSPPPFTVYALGCYWRLGVGRVLLDLDDLLDRWEDRVACHDTVDNRFQQEMAQLRHAWFLC
jgi:hypothetical protein